jgi:hypothetical protein
MCLVNLYFAINTVVPGSKGSCKIKKKITKDAPNVPFYELDRHFHLVHIFVTVNLYILCSFFRPPDGITQQLTWMFQKKEQGIRIKKKKNNFPFPCLLKIVSQIYA